MQYFLRYSHTGGHTWQRVGWRTEEEQYEVNFDQLPGGESCLLAVVATDGINTTIQETKPFKVNVKSCRAMILAPVDGTKYRRGQTVQLMGQGYYFEEACAEREALCWMLSIDGVLGHGSLVEIESLSPGDHCITLSAGKEPRQGSEMVTIWYEGEEQAM